LYLFIGNLTKTTNAYEVGIYTTAVSISAKLIK